MTVSRLERKLELRERLWEDTQRSRTDGNGGGFRSEFETEEPLKLHLRLKESEQARDEMSQSVSDLTGTLYLKEAELQYCHSQVFRLRNEAVLLAKGTSSLKTNLSECEFVLERQSKELVALNSEQRVVREELTTARLEKEELLERWLEEKREEAERVNRHNATQERWHRFASRLNKHLCSEAQQPCATKCGQGGVDPTDQSPAMQD